VETTLTQQATGRSKWRPMPFIALGVSMIIVDATIVNVAIPSIIRDIGISVTDAEWVNSIYSLVFAALLLTTGRVGDIYGRRRLFLLGTVVFVAASLVAALAPSAGVLILGRFLQGIGGAMLLPASLSTVNAMYQGKDRAIAFAIWGSTIGGTAALGPLLGGWLTTAFSWRWAFLINVPIGALVVYGLLRFVPETKDPGARRGVDLPGTVTSVVGLGALVFALIEGQRYGWWRPTATFEAAGLRWSVSSVAPTGAAFVVAAVSLLAFWLVERRRARRGALVLLDLRLFTIRSFRYGNLAALIVSLGEFGLLFALPLFLQSVLGYSALQTGVVLLALAMGTFVASPFAARIANSRGGRTVVRLGLALEVVGIVGIGAFVGVGISAWRLVPWLFIYGAGVGLATAQLTGVILADIAVEESGQGSAVQSTSRQVGAALGTAILGAVLFTSLGSGVADRLQQAGVPAAQAQQIATAVKERPSEVLPVLAARPDGSAVVGAASEAFVRAARDVAWTGAAFVLLGLLATLLLPHDRGAGQRPEDESGLVAAGAAPASGAPPLDGPARELTGQPDDGGPGR
jgi:EmrB/QacA subfamily drug resistance transporter